MNNKKVVIITGASSGFGYALAEALQAKGHRVYGGARRLDEMAALQAKGIHIGQLDVTDDESVKQFVERVLAEQGRIDILYNNAGYGEYGAIEEVPLERVQRQFDVNFFGVVRMNSAVLPIMRQQRSGRIVITCSVVSHLSTVCLGYYAASKHALAALAMSLRQEVEALGIEVVQIEPGLSNTHFKEVAMPLLKENSQLDDYRQLSQKYYAYSISEFKKAPLADQTVKYMVRAGLDKNPKWWYRTTRDSKLAAIGRRIFGDKALFTFVHGDVAKQ